MFSIFLKLGRWYIGYLVVAESLDCQEFIGSLLNDAKILDHVSICDVSGGSQHVVDGRSVTVYLVEQGLNSCKQRTSRCFLVHVSSL